METRILIIEDNPANLDLMTYLFQAFGFTTLTAVDGRAGLEAVRREVPDLIICDLQLPEIDGYEVARRLKADPGLRSIPLLAVTALAMVGERDRVLGAGFDGYISKPIDPQTVVRQVEAFLRPEQRRVVQEVSRPPAAPPSTGDAGPSRGTILIVDDKPTNLAVFRWTLEPYGFEVTTAQAVQEGLELARRLVPDIILSDVNLHGESGFDLIKAVKADPLLRPIPFIFLSASAGDWSNRATGLALGAVRYLSYPIEPERLLAEVEACLRQKGEG